MTNSDKYLLGGAVIGLGILYFVMKSQAAAAISKETLPTTVATPVATVPSVATPGIIPTPATTTPVSTVPSFMTSFKPVVPGYVFKVGDEIFMNLSAITKVSGFVSKIDPSKPDYVYFQQVLGTGDHIPVLKSKITKLKS